MKTKTPLPEIEKHSLAVGANGQGKHLRMDITRMAIKLLFGHGSEDGLDNCRVDVIHDLLKKTGNVFTEMADQESIRLMRFEVYVLRLVYIPKFVGVYPHFSTYLLGLLKRVKNTLNFQF